MVFTKLTDTDKEQLAIFGQEYEKKAGFQDESLDYAGG